MFFIIFISFVCSLLIISRKQENRRVTEASGGPPANRILAYIQHTFGIQPI